VALLAPGKGKTKKAYVWVYRTTNFVSQRAVYYDFCKDRSAWLELLDQGWNLTADSAVPQSQLAH
ncbi:IS66 family transposase, partial [Roseateles saccharophilus]